MLGGNIGAGKASSEGQLSKSVSLPGNPQGGPGLGSRSQQPAGGPALASQSSSSSRSGNLSTTLRASAPSFVPGASRFVFYCCHTCIRPNHYSIFTTDQRLC